jgi:hypothetical protein
VKVVESLRAAAVSGGPHCTHRRPEPVNGLCPLVPLPPGCHAHAPDAGDLDQCMSVFFLHTLRVWKRVERGGDTVAGDGAQEIHVMAIVAELSFRKQLRSLRPLWRKHLSLAK